MDAEHCWPTTPNIVGCYMGWYTLLHVVVGCCIHFHTITNMDTTTPNLVGVCLHEAHM